MASTQFLVNNFLAREDIFEGPLWRLGFLASIFQMYLPKFWGLSEFVLKGGGRGKT